MSLRSTLVMGSVVAAGLAVFGAAQMTLSRDDEPGASAIISADGHTHSELSPVEKSITRPGFGREPSATSSRSSEIIVSTEVIVEPVQRVPQGDASGMQEIVSDRYLGHVVGTDYVVRFLEVRDPVFDRAATNEVPQARPAWCVYLDGLTSDVPGEYGGFCIEGEPEPGFTALIGATAEGGGPQLVVVAPFGASRVQYSPAGATAVITRPTAGIAVLPWSESAGDEGKPPVEFLDSDGSVLPTQARAPGVG